MEIPSIVGAGMIGRVAAVQAWTNGANVNVLSLKPENMNQYADNKIMCLIKSDKGSRYIAVHDDGKGIPEEERRAVFKAFTRLDDSRNRETGGYGLGLAIVSRIAELHGGAVTADSSTELGGAQFTISWPMPD